MNWKKAVSVMLVGIMALSNDRMRRFGRNKHRCSFWWGKYRRIYGGCRHVRFRR